VDSVLLDLSVLVTDSRFRGIGRYTTMLARGLLSQDLGLRFLGIEALRWLRPGQVSSDLPSIIARLTHEQASQSSQTRWAWQQRLGLLHTVRAIRPQLVHTMHPDATPLGPLGCPRVTTLYDLITLRFPDRYARSWKEGYHVGRRLLDTRRYHSADHLLAISECSARDAMEILGVSADKISVVYPGVDLSRWSPDPQPGDATHRARLGVADQPYVLCVGAGDWRKNPEGMLSALAIARQRSGLADLTLLWAGRLSPSEKSHIERLTQDMQLESAVLLAGFVSDEALCAAYRGALAQLFVSRYEGFGYPVIEAMALGCPVITANCSSTVEIAEDAAIVVNPEDPDAIAEAIVAFADSASERARYRQRGLDRATHFSFERMGRETAEVYRSVIKSRG